MTIDDFEPIAVWDARDPNWPNGQHIARSKWIESLIGDDMVMTYRAEFRIVDVPFVTIFAYEREFYHIKCHDHGEGCPPRRPPYNIILSELPPEDIL